MSDRLVDMFGEFDGGEAVFDLHGRGLYSTDASIYQVMPLGVVVPGSLEGVRRAVEICGGHRVGMLPRGGGTSLAGQCVNEAVVIDVSGKCDALMSVDVAERSCVVEAGVTVDDLNDRIQEHGLFFAPDPSTARQATIGGCIGNNAAGVHSILYGRTSENVLAVDACLWDGTRVEFGMGSALRDKRVMGITREVVEIVKAHAGLIRERYATTLRRSAGYQLDVILDQLEAGGGDLSRVNLADLLCGSEGTLAMTLGATLKLHPIPKCKGLAVAAFGSIDEAIATVEPLLELGPAGVELLDDLILDLARKNREQARYVELLPTLTKGETRAVLYVEFFGDLADEINDRLERVAGVVGSGAVELITDVGDMERAWKLRKAGEPLLHGVEGARKPLGFIEDCAIPVGRLGEFASRLRGIVEREGTVASYYAHASVGVLHVRPLLDLRDPNDEAAMHRIASECADLAKELGGVASGEHGDGRARGPVLERFMGKELMEAHRAIKRVFDPHGLMNPGNIVSPGPIESISINTRIRPGSTNLTIDGIDTGMRFDDEGEEGGLGHAVEMCNGAGVCRKKMDGVMCPSYQGTLDERHSTRGRGNALRLAITGQSKFGDEGGDAQWNDAETLETLDLCLSCKACKTECPSGVDIAKLKSEYLWQGFKKNGVPLKVQVLSRIHTLNRLGSLMPWVSNAAAGWAPVRSVLNHGLGIHRDRSLPRFASAVKSVAIPRDDRKKVVVVSDSMVSHTEPGIVGVAVRVLERLGYGVGVLTVSDLGRSAVSQGHLGFAKKDGERSLGRIDSFIGEKIVEGVLFLEPSALSVVMDEWGDLVGEEFFEMLGRLKSKARLVEDFVGTLWGEHPSAVEIDVVGQQIVVHTHCHQKALWGSETTMGVFEAMGVHARLIDAGCCGMAGAFGFMEGKYDLSMKIGEQRLMPAVRGRGDGAIVVAGGTSCRHQIFDATGARALHPIEAVRGLLKR